MALITGTVSDIGMQPLSGDLSVSSVDFRPEGDVLVAPEIRSFPIVAGVVNAELLTGPCRVTIRVGSHARRSFDVVVPNVASLSLAMLVEAGFEYEPPVVSVVAGHRVAAEAAADRAESAADRAESAADDVDAAIVDAAGQVVADVEADRVAAQAARTGAESARDAAALSESAAATSAAVAATQATLAGEKAGDAASSAAASAGSATAAAGSASDAASSASDAAGSATDADTARAAAVVARTGAETAQSGAESARDAADGHAGRAEQAANEFGLTATATTGAEGSNATVTVTGDGPAYGLSFTVPRGDKGDKGDKGDRGDDGEVSQAMLDAAVASLVDNAPEALDTLTELAAALGNDPNFATTTATAIGERAKIDGAPAAYNTLGKLVAALQNHELGGSTDASLLTGALTDAVDASAAMVHSSHTGLGGAFEMPISELAYGLVDMSAYIAGKSDVGHTHPVSDLSATGTASSSTFLRGDGSWATPPSGGGGSTDASLLTGALTNQVDASDAMVTYEYQSAAEEDPVTLTNPLGVALTQAAGWLPPLMDLFNMVQGKADAAHKHPVGDLTTTGTASSSTFLRGDGSWATPANTTYSTMSQAEAENAASTTARLATGQRLHQAVAANPRLSAAPATWRWDGTALPTAASQVHAQARAGDFIVAPNLTTDPGWHQITGV